MKKRILTLALVLALALSFTLPALADVYNLSLSPDWVQSKTQNYFSLENTNDSAGNPRPGQKIPTEVLKNMTKIDVYMPEFLVDGEPSEDQHGLVFVLGGFGNWWVTAGRDGSEIIPWKDGKVTVNASDFPMNPSDIIKISDDESGGYLVIVDGWWTATWAELGITKVEITYTSSGGGSGSGGSGSGGTGTTGTTTGGTGTDAATTKNADGTVTPKVGDNGMVPLAMALMFTSTALFFILRKKVKA